jgi:periplasmic copper chaperone A
MTKLRLLALTAIAAVPLVLSACGKQEAAAPAKDPMAAHKEMSAPAATGPAKIVIAHNWARPAAAAGNSAGYFHIRNDGGTGDQLLAVESIVADRTEIHQSKVEDGVMRMTPMKDGVAIPAGADIEFKPGGMHVMFIGLKAPLKAGQKIPVTLVFRDSGRITVELPVQTTPAGHGDDEHGEMEHGDMDHSAH